MTNVKEERVEWFVGDKKIKESSSQIVSSREVRKEDIRGSEQEKECFLVHIFITPKIMKAFSRLFLTRVHAKGKSSTGLIIYHHLCAGIWH